MAFIDRTLTPSCPACDDDGGHCEICGTHTSAAADVAALEKQPPFAYDSPAPVQDEPCTTHEITVMLIVRADVQEGTTEAHAIEYISAHLENREPSPDLHEDIFDELESATMRVHGRGVGQGSMLVKRPERMLEYMSRENFRKRIYDAGACNFPFPLPNVWLGTTVWDQPSADRAVPILLSTPAAKRFVSVEPMLGPVDIEDYLGWRGDICPDCCGSGQDDYSTCPTCNGTGQFGLGWVICGGETGPGARPMHPDWARKVRDDCVAAGVPFFFKQWGEWGTAHISMITGEPSWWAFTDFQHYCNKAPTHMSKGDKLICPDGHVPSNGCEEGKNYPMVPVRRVGKAKAGRLLDGRTWEELPV